MGTQPVFVQVLTKIKIPLCGWALVTVQSCYSKVEQQVYYKMELHSLPGKASSFHHLSVNTTALWCLRPGAARHPGVTGCPSRSTTSGGYTSVP
ncbi:unnamed protein product [Boreogadus saida]